MPKRTISDFLDGHITDSAHDFSSSSRPQTRARLESDVSNTSSKPSYQQTLPYSSPLHTAPKQIPFQQPTQLLSFSYTRSRELEFTNSALRYFVDPPPGAKLGYGYERWVRRPEERGRIDGLVKAISRARCGPAAAALMDVGIVAWRGVMTKILTSPYEERESWELNVMFVNGTVYLEEHLSEVRLREKNDMEPRHRLQSYYGYAFESYCTSATPVQDKKTGHSGDQLGWGGDVDTNVQWCSVVRTKLGNTKLVLGGEVDCVREKYTGQTDTFVELKTSLVIRGPHDEAKFERKLLKFYIQSFLLGVPEIVVGFRTTSGVVTTTQSFRTTQIPRLVRGKPGAWDPLICLDWGHRFITFLMDVVQRGRDVSVWRVKFVPGTGANIDMLDPADIEDVTEGGDRVGFLPKWYWDELHALPDSNTHMGPPARSVEDPKSLLALDVPATNAGWQL